MTPIQQHYANLAATMLPALRKRGFEADYVSNRTEALATIMNDLKSGSTVSYGGSMTLTEIGFPQALQNSECIFLDRFAPTNDAEKDAMFAKIATCDYYLLSTNAITTDGQLINIDGMGNRLSAMMFGPKKVIIVVGMNKVCPDLDSAYKRVKLFAAPPNTNRLNKNTPCAQTGQCADCLSSDCICSYTVVTRRSNIPNRIKVLLVGESLGY